MPPTKSSHPDPFFPPTFREEEYIVERIPGSFKRLRPCYNRRQVFVSDTSKRVCMYTQEQCCGLSHTAVSRVTLLVVGAAATFIPGWTAQGQTSSEPSSSIRQSDTPDSRTHMSEALRSTVKKVVVLPSPSPANQAITGTCRGRIPIFDRTCADYLFSAFGRGAVFRLVTLLSQ